MKLTAAAVLLAAAVAVGAQSSSGGVAGHESHIRSLFALFQENPFTGGQVAPRSYRWANERATVFLQFDRTRDPRALRYVGISVKGTFCAETQPGGANGGFPHFHRLDAPSYAQGHGGPPGTQGYWLLWAAVDEFAAFDGREIKPGVDYGFQPTPPPACGGSPTASFAGPGAHRLTQAEIRQLAAQFPDNPFRGGQTAPRLYRWVTGDTLIFVEFDKASVAKARSLRYVGVAKRGVFCRDDQPHGDFAFFQRLKAPTYAKGRGGTAREPGLWHLALAVDEFRMPWGNVAIGDRSPLRGHAASRLPKSVEGPRQVAAEIETERA